MKENNHKTRDFKNSIYTKVIGISADQYKYIDKVRIKKSKAGMLNEIINFYKQYVNATLQKMPRE